MDRVAGVRDRGPLPELIARPEPALAGQPAQAGVGVEQLVGRGGRAPLLSEGPREIWGVKF